MIKIHDLTLSDFFVMSDALNAIEQDENGKDLPLNERTDAFIFEQYRHIVQQLSGLGRKYVKDDTFVELVIDELSPQYSELCEIARAEVDADSIKEDIFYLDDKPLLFAPLKEWTFNKWVIFENGTKTAKDADGHMVQDGRINFLPLAFGEWNDDLPLLEAKIGHICNELPARETLPVFMRLNSKIAELKALHGFIYPDSANEGNSFVDNHAAIFGWQEVLRGLAEKRVFGNYLELKQTPALQVLEYLNCSISLNKAQQQDIKAQQRKNKK
jgi:hypothetical protein